MIRKVLKCESMNPNDSVMDASDSVFEYSLYKGKYLVITGLKDTTSKEFVVPEIVSYMGDEYPVIAIGDGAFLQTRNLKSVTLPKSVVNIGSQAFSGCSMLKDINTENIERLGAGAFYGCSSLEYVNIQNVERIEDDAFSGCTSLKEVDLCYDLWSIGKHAFAGCSSLEEIELPDEIGMIGLDAFKGCKKLDMKYNKDSKFVL